MRWASERVGIGAAIAAALALYGADSRGDANAEPTYGRIAGDMTLVAGLGTVLASGGPRAEGELRIRYLETAGLFATYEDGALVGSSVEPRRVLAGGLELRPLFLFRWLKGHETSHARLDLALDSVGFELGVTLPQSVGSSFASRPGFEVGVGVELPILASATGPWIGLHGAIRWSDEALTSGEVQSDADRELCLALTLAWHQVVWTHAVDVGDLRPE
jgi:hypothetical protein